MRKSDPDIAPVGEAPAFLPDPASPASPPRRGIERGTATYWRVAVALFFAGFTTFSLMYAVQPLLPEFAAEFHLTPAASSLALSLTTGCVAFSILLCGAGSEQLGRRNLMFGSLAVAAALHIAASLAPDWHLLLALRALEGIALGGVPAVAMAYLAEEMHPNSLASAMGLYIGGSALGGMMGRVGMGYFTDLYSWRVALGSLGAIDFATALAFLVLLPPSRNFVRRTGFSLAYHCDAWLRHLRAPSLLLLFATAFLACGVFVATFNYLTFRLAGAPYELTQSQISMVFVVYLAGVFASPAAGHLADRIGRPFVLLAGATFSIVGLLLTLAIPLVVMMTGVTLMTLGFFIVHAIASGWVGKLAAGNKGHASSLYLLSYYIGSSTMGSAGGWFWKAGGWPAVAAFEGMLLLVLLAIALRLRRIG